MPCCSHHVPVDLGSWSVENIIGPGRLRLEDRLDLIKAQNGKVVCLVAQSGSTPDGEAQAVIDLLAAAGDLFKALLSARRAIEHGDVPRRLWVLASIDAALDMVRR